MTDASAPTTTGRIRPVIGDAGRLLDWAGRAPSPTGLVVTPEQLHRRNVKRRLAEVHQPRSSLRFADAADIAHAVLEAVESDPTVEDRLDRLRHLEAFVESDDPAVDRLRTVLGADLDGRLPAIEAARARVETMTGWQAARLDALDSVATSLPGVAAADTADLLSGATAAEQFLIDRSGPTHSRGGLLEAAATAIRDSDGAAWHAAFPTVERVAVAGVSTLDAPLLDLLATAAAHTATDVTLFLRSGTGPSIADRLATRLPADAAVTVEEPASGSSTPAAPVTEFVADNPADEARLAMAIVAGLVADGVSTSDILVVARDADSDERSLRRAANRYGYPLAVWAQLPVTETLPYGLFAAATDLLSAAEVDLDTLLRPLDLGWVPPELGSDDGDGDAAEDAAASTWPAAPTTVERLRVALSEGGETGGFSPTRIGVDAGSLVEWEGHVADCLDDGRLDSADAQPLLRLLTWASSQPRAPNPVAVHEVFEPLVDAYRTVVLPLHRDADSDDLQATERHARAVVRLDSLLGDTRSKYEEWLAAGYTTRSWESVADIAERIATTRPGRREHANAAAIDVVDATDAWLRTEPYVIAVGLVDGVWPQRIESVFPTSFRAAVADGTPPETRGLAVPGRWTERRELDHLWSAAAAATDQLICTRYTADRDATAQEPSPYLESLGARRVDAAAVQSLRTDGRLPEAVRPTVAETGGSR